MKESLECLAIVVDRKIKSNDVLYCLSDLFLLHGKRLVELPHELVLENS